MNQEAIDQFEEEDQSEASPSREDLMIEIRDISERLRTITLTTNFVSNMLSIYIIYRSISWVFK